MKVTDVDSSDDKSYDKASQALGKTITMKFYDNSVTLTFQGDKTPINLKKYSETQYRRIEKNPHSEFVMTLDIKTTFGVISSIEYLVEVNPNSTSGNNKWGKMTAKRF
ncbi:hypothetical protein [Daejeonella rubra]|nr:hypothetical protein [Daejeonella rubra]